MAFVSLRTGREAIWRVPRLGGSATMLVDNAIDPAISPDGRQVAFSRAGPESDDRVFVAPIDRPQEAVMLTGTTAGVGPHLQPDWSPDGRRIAYAGTTGAAADIWITGVGEGAAPRQVTKGVRALRARWGRSPADLLVSAFWEPGMVSLRRVDLDTGASRPLAPPLIFGPQAGHPEFDLSRDGAVVAFSQQHPRGDIWVVQSRPGAF